MKPSRIIQLSAQVANQIAAGEVVERPASVVKELLENAIDANASKIEIDIEGGGLHLIRVRDNGSGIVKEDLALAFSSHATSKIQTQADLEDITTMGFRGEALASIASVSRCRLISKTKENDAWQIQFSADTPHLSPSAHPEGTTVEVADLFYNTPVRRKFLRSEKTEFQAIEEVVKRVALAFPHVAISLKHQQKLIRQYPKDTLHMAKARVAKVCGNQFIENAAYFSMQAGELVLAGYLGFPCLAKRFADCQYFFVNTRMIKDRLINHVIKTVYSEHPQFELGTYPSYVLYLTLPTHEVDVNVHPTKQEVRFSQATMVHDFLTKCVRDTLFQISGKASYPAMKSTPVQSSFNRSSYTEKGALQAFYQVQNAATIGERYAFLEEPQGVVIIDLQRAKSSLSAFYFERFKGNIPNKAILFPVRVQMKVASKEAQAIIKQLQAYGFEVGIEKDEVCLFRQPAVLTEPLTEQVLTALLNGALKAELSNVLNKLNIAFVDKDLLHAWAKAHPQGAYVRLSHDEIAQEIPIN